MNKLGIALLALTVLGATQIQPQAAEAKSLKSIVKKATRRHHSYPRTYAAQLPYYNGYNPYGYNGVTPTNAWNPNQYTDQFGQWHDAGADPSGGATGGYPGPAQWGGASGMVPPAPGVVQRNLILRRLRGY
jgi:hypothetical protein